MCTGPKNGTRRLTPSLRQHGESVKAVGRRRVTGPAEGLGDLEGPLVQRLRLRQLSL